LVLAHVEALILVLVHGRNGEIPFFVADLVAEIRFVAVAGVPKTFLGVVVVKSMVVTLTKPDAVEDENLDLGPPVADVGYPARFEIFLGLLRYVAWVS